MVPHVSIDGFFFLVCVCEKCHWNFDRDCIEFVIVLGSMDILTILIPIHEQVIPIFSFYQCLNFQCTGLSPHWSTLFLGVLVQS